MRDDGDDDDDDSGDAGKTSLFARILTPRVDDLGLPIADSLVCVAANVVLATVVLAGGLPRPSWLVAATFVPRIRALPYVLPAVGHGLSLASCWVLGAFAAAAYRKEAYGATGASGALVSTLQAGAFATGILIASTQLHLYLTVGNGAVLDASFPSTTADMEVLQAAFDVAVDVTVQAAALLAWRQYRAQLFSKFGD